MQDEVITVDVDFDVDFELKLMESDLEFMKIFRTRDENGALLEDWVDVQLAAFEDDVFLKIV